MGLHFTLEVRLSTDQVIIEMQFKPYSASNFAACVELFDLNCPSFFAIEEREDYVKFLTANPGNYLLHYEQEVLVCCFGIGALSDPAPSLNWIMVHPDHQRSGYGHKMMTYFIDELTRHSKDAALIATSQYAKAFFSKYGAEQLSFEENGWGRGMHRIDMKMPLVS